MYEVVTHPDYRNRGFARDLLLHLLRWSRSKGAERSYLLVIEQNAPAQSLYRSLGYEEIYKYWYRRKKRESL